MKADSTIHRELRRLHRFAQSGEGSVAERRIAYAVACAIRWAREDTKGWPAPLEDVKAQAQCLANDSESTP
jgi:hypothetical protein